MTGQVVDDKKRRNVDKNSVESRLQKELEEAKRKVDIGSQVKVKWSPGEVKIKNGKPLEEEVIGDTIYIYAEDPDRAVELLNHGFAEWLLNHHSKPYRLMINKLITLFEEMQYQQKEQIADAIAELL